MFSASTALYQEAMEGRRYQPPDVVSAGTASQRRIESEQASLGRTKKPQAADPPTKGWRINMREHQQSTHERGRGLAARSCSFLFLFGPFSG